MKGSVNLDVMTDRGFAEYSAICGRTLARAHARSCDPTIVSGYLGNGTQFDRAVGEFAEAYADQTERDHAAFDAAVKAGRVRAMRNC
jgi:hypothetical protein